MLHIQVKQPVIIQEAMTAPISWLKVVYCEDAQKDQLGRTLTDPLITMTKRFSTLLAEHRDDKWDKTHVKYKEMRDLSEAIKARQIERLRWEIASTPIENIEHIDIDGVKHTVEVDDPRMDEIERIQDLPWAEVPEVPFYQGFDLLPVLMDDIRYDWTCAHVAGIQTMRYIAHRMFLTLEEIKDFFGTIDEDIVPNCPSEYYQTGGIETPEFERGHTDLESPTLGQLRAVWEFYDLTKGKVVYWVDGANKPGRVDTIITETTHRHPFFPLILNPVSGRLEGVSDVMLQMHLQDEINRKRTMGREMERSAAPRFVAPRGAFTDEELQHMQFSDPYDMILTERPDVHNLIHELAPARFDPRLTDTSMSRVELEMMSGTPGSGLGGTGSANFATEEAIANEQMGIQSNRRMRLLEKTYADVARYILEIALQSIPESTVREWVGPGAVWPLLTSDTIRYALGLDIKVSLRGNPDQTQAVRKVSELAGFLRDYTGIPINGLSAAKLLDKLLDTRGLLADLMPPITGTEAAQLSGMAAAQPRGSAPATSGSPGGVPMAAPPAPTSVPNNPVA
jgi:hypothetical protein